MVGLHTRMVCLVHQLVGLVHQLVGLVHQLVGLVGLVSLAFLDTQVSNLRLKKINILFPFKKNCKTKYHSRKKIFHHVQWSPMKYLSDESNV